MLYGVRNRGGQLVGGWGDEGRLIMVDRRTKTGGSLKSWPAGWGSVGGPISRRLFQSNFVVRYFLHRPPVPLDQPHRH